MKPMTLAAGAILLAAATIFETVTMVPPGMQAVVRRFGRVVHVQQAGLLATNPWPLEQVEVLPAGTQEFRERSPDGTSFLTADSHVVVLDATLAWHVSDAAAYASAGADVAQTLPSLLRAACVSVAAHTRVADFLAPQSGPMATGSEVVTQVNAALNSLAQTGRGLGVEALRAQIAASRPAGSDSTQEGGSEPDGQLDSGLASARAYAAQARQQADSDRHRRLAEAHASAIERIETARTTTATLTALETRMAPTARPALLDQLYRERIAAVLHAAGSVTAVDAKSVSRVILSGGN